VARKNTARSRSFFEYACEAPGSAEKDADRRVQTAKARIGVERCGRGRLAEGGRSRKTRRAR
jgi:hypothetical protein